MPRTGVVSQYTLAIEVWGHTGLKFKIVTPFHVLDETHSAGFLVVPSCGTAGTVL